MRDLICCFILAAVIVPAQAPAPLRTTTTEVMFDLVVRDKKARIVRDLKPEEIQVLEDGVPQTLHHFEFVEGRTAEAGAAVQAPAATAKPPAQPSSAPPTVNDLRDASVVSIVVGPLTPNVRKEALEALLGFLKDELRPNVYIGVFGIWMGDIGAIQSYTNDADLLAAAVKRAVSISGSTAQPDMDFSGLPPATLAPAVASPAAAAAQALADEIDALVGGDLIAESAEDYGASARELLNIQHLIQAQQSLPGRKVVFLFLPGLLVHPDARDFLYSSISVANRANVTVYGWDSIDNRASDLAAGNQMLASAAKAIMKQQQPGHIVNQNDTGALETGERAVQADSRSQLAILAQGTGGALLSNGKELKGQLDRAMEDVHSHYVLTYAPANPAADGSFRKIQVKVARPNVTVFARSGYYALPLINGREVYPYEMATLGALNTKPLPHQFDFHAAALRFRPGPEKTRYAYVFQAPIRGLTVTKDKEWATVHVSVTALVKDAQGQVVDRISRDMPYRMPADRPQELKSAAVSFTAPFALPPGRYLLETAAVDRESMKTSVRRSVLVVEPAPAGLAASDIALVRRVSAINGPANPADPLEARGGKVLPELSSPVAFAPGDKMSFFAVAYPPGPPPGPVALSPDQPEKDGMRLQTRPATVKMSLVLTRDGETVLDSKDITVQPEPNGAASVLASLPAAKVQPGNYDVRLTFTSGGQTATSETAVTVQPERAPPAEMTK